MFSINATLPVFFVILLGYVLKQKKIVNNNFVSAANVFIFNVALPVLLFRDIASANISQVFDLRYVLYCMIVTSISFFAIWGGTKLFMKDQSMIGAFVQSSFRGSAAIMGIAFVQNMYGNSGMAPLMIIGAVPLYNIYSVIVLTMEGENKEGSQIKNAIINICKNPIILGIVAGLLGSLIHFYDYTPMLVTKTIDNIAVMASPLALVTIGAGFKGRKALAKIKPTLIASVMKLLVLPAVFLPVAALLGFHDQKMIGILIMLGAPTTVSCYIMAENMKNDGVLTASVIVVTTLLSSVTLTMWIYLLKINSFI
jgi:Predicted permeases